MACVSLFAVGRVMKNIMANRKHLTGEEFRTYMKGGKSMTDAQRSRVTSHLGICQECQGRVDEWIKGIDLEDSLIDG